MGKCVLLSLMAFGFALNSFAAKPEIRVAITVDDLPTHGATSTKYSRQMMFDKMLAAFKKHRVPPVYGFINAQKLEEEAQGEHMLWQWIKAGHLLGNHSYSHASLTKSTAEEFMLEIEKNEPALLKLMGAKDFKYFRFPFLHEGDTIQKREAIRKHLYTKGYKIAQVTVDWEDWAWNNPYVHCLDQGRKLDAKKLEESYVSFALEKLDRAQALSKIIFGRDIPHVLLAHIGAMNAEAMDRLLGAMVEKGARFIPLDEAARDPAYQVDPGWVSAHGENFLDQILQARKLKYPRGGRRVPVKAIQRLCAKQ